MSFVKRGGALDDPSAPPGTQPRARALQIQIIQHVNDTQSDASRLENYVRMFREERAWTLLKNKYGRPFATFDEFCQADYPYGPSLKKKPLAQLILERKARQAEIIANPGTLNVNGTNQHSKDGGCNNVTPSPGRQGTDSEYEAARLNRDAPEILAKVQTGELPSLHAGMIAAGLKPRPIQITTRDPDRIAKLL